MGAGFDDPSSDDASQQFGAGPLNVQRSDTPNDPRYDSSEPDDPTPGVDPTTNLFEERFDLFGFPSLLTPDARYLEGPNTGQAQVSGFNAAGAWKLDRGHAGVDVAILDTGINWGSGGVRTQVALNQAELPLPRRADGTTGGYDLNGNGSLDVDDYAADARVDKAVPTGQDLIRAFSDGTDADANGYVDDIAGWDFFDDDNDPADASSYFAASNHGTGRSNEAVERGDDGEGALGVCPRCRFMPLRVWDTFVSDQNSFAMGIVYATDNGVEVIEGADGGLYHSAFAESASRYAYEHGVAQVYSGDDLNTANHNYPAAYSHTMLIQGVVGDTEGLGLELPSADEDPGIRDALIALLRAAGVGTNLRQLTYFRGANTTQFGGKSSISMQGPTGSTNTGKAAGAAALVIAAGRNRDVELTADETRELLEQTAEDVLPGNTLGAGTPDPAQVGFDTHFGYGRANVGEAVAAVHEDRIPPEASIATPDWYAPVTGATVRIGGLARDRHRAGETFTWKLEYGLGLAPTSWTSVREGSSASRVEDFGTLPLDDIRAALAARTEHPDRDDPAGPVLDITDPRLDPFGGQFTVRLVVTSSDGDALPGVDRKVLTALDDRTLRPGFPKRLGAGGEAPLRYADLDGDNVPELVLPAQDGRVHAYRPDGTELPGWPVRTETQFAARAHLDSPALRELEPPFEPPRGPTIVDLTGDGRPEVVTAAGERLYAWDFEGKRLGGWPVHPDPSRENCAPARQSKPLNHPKCGFVATPAAARLDGAGRPPAIVAPALDGRLYAYRADGSPVPGFPVRLQDPDLPEDQRMTAESINNPAIGDLDGDGRDDVVVATNEVYGGGAGPGDDVSFIGVLGDAALTTSRVYAVRSTGTESPGGRPFLDGWPVKPEGIIQNVLPFIGPGHDPALMTLDGAPQVVVSVTGGMLSLYAADGTKTRDMQQNVGPNGGGLNLFESAVVGDLAGAGPAVVKYQIDLTQAANLLLVGQNLPYSHRIGAFEARTGATHPGFPVITDDYQFLSTSTIAKVQPGATNQVLAGTGLGLLHAYDGLTGRDAPGFPKVTGGWLFSPAALSGEGRIAAITREGFLFEWSVADAPACQTEWPAFRHDAHGTGNHSADGTPPAAPEALALEALGADRFTLAFRSPGDDGFCGTAARYVADAGGTALDLGAPVAGGGELRREIRVPATVRRIRVRAEDERGVRGAPGVLVRDEDGGGFVPLPPGDDDDGPGTIDPPGGGGPAGPPSPPKPGPGGGSAVKHPAKLGVARSRLGRRLEIAAPITRRASGAVGVELASAGRRVRFSAPIDPARGRVVVSRRAVRRQARLGTGIVTLRYAGDADTRPQTVRLRAASRPARLALGRPVLRGGRLQASGTVARAARGVVRLQLQYDAGGATRTVELRARIRGGRWRLDAALPRAVLDGIAARRGTLHSYTLFTGDLGRRIRGEMRSFQVLGSR